jgi:hypothetical protein
MFVFFSSFFKKPWHLRSEYHDKAQQTHKTSNVTLTPCTVEQNFAWQPHIGIPGAALSGVCPVPCVISGFGWEASERHRDEHLH